MKPPKIENVANLSDAAMAAAYELLAEMLRQQASVLNIRIDGVTYEGKQIGSFEISARKVED